ncbi:shikimate kinase [Edaphobacillus lindanitolerans]|uniref:Shikimate kinase n=1 Tax=Edaphobacillus lindanitolerans TaxID=550447 RepID=A0A1U7PPV4_9BACI|nr:shikimate kinase [Edaphobacillus lindanitolerans]SIT81933.1 shikimate kinase [Edaphobacillus lindanitolerans]
MKKVYLIGYMGSGKSAIGRRLSYALKMPYYDMDREIERKMGMKIPEIFETFGEEYFRTLETEFLLNFRDEWCIISTGGGTPMRKENREILRATGLVLFLNAPFHEIWRRIRTDRNRPIVQRSTREELQKLYAERKKVYRRTAHISVNTEGRSLRQATEYAARQVRRLKGKQPN